MLQLLIMRQNNRYSLLRTRRRLRRQVLHVLWRNRNMGWNYGAHDWITRSVTLRRWLWIRGLWSTGRIISTRRVWLIGIGWGWCLARWLLRDVRVRMSVWAHILNTGGLRSLRIMMMMIRRGHVRRWRRCLDHAHHLLVRRLSRIRHLEWRVQRSRRQ